MIMVVSFPPKRFQILATISYDLQWQLYNLYIEALQELQSNGEGNTGEFILKLHMYGKCTNYFNLNYM